MSISLHSRPAVLPRPPRTPRTVLRPRPRNGIASLRTHRPRPAVRGRSTLAAPPHAMHVLYRIPRPKPPTFRRLCRPAARRSKKRRGLPPLSVRIQPHPAALTFPTSRRPARRRQIKKAGFTASLCTHPASPCRSDIPVVPPPAV
jgi:hypothetical protein